MTEHLKSVLVLFIMATKSDIRGIIRGDTQSLTIDFTESTPAVNIIGWTFFFTLRKYYDIQDNIDSGNGVVIKKTWGASTSPATTIVISDLEMKIDPGTYVYDMQYKDLSGNVVTVVYGQFEVLNEATVRI